MFFRASKVRAGQSTVTLTLESLEERIVLSSTGWPGRHFSQLFSRAQQRDSSSKVDSAVGDTTQQTNLAGSGQSSPFNPAGSAPERTRPQNGGDAAGRQGQGGDGLAGWMRMMLADDPATGGMPGLAGATPEGPEAGPGESFLATTSTALSWIEAMMRATAFSEAPVLPTSGTDADGNEVTLSAGSANDLLLLTLDSTELLATLVPVDQATPLAVAVVLSTSLPQEGRPAGLEEEALLPVFGSETPVGLKVVGPDGTIVATFGEELLRGLANQKKEGETAPADTRNPGALSQFIGGVQEALRELKAPETPREEPEEPSLDEFLPEFEVSAQVLTPLRTSAVFLSSWIDPLLLASPPVAPGGA